MALYVKFECATCENENCYGHSLQTTVKVCDGYKHTDTNADRIRSMTDEELAEWIAGYALGLIGGSLAMATEAWLDWLKQEANE